MIFFVLVNIRRYVLALGESAVLVRKREGRKKSTLALPFFVSFHSFICRTFSLISDLRNFCKLTRPFVHLPSSLVLFCFVMWRVIAYRGAFHTSLPLIYVFFLKLITSIQGLSSIHVCVLWS